MALILECVCSPDASLCNLTRLVWVVDITNLQFGSISATQNLSLQSSAGALASMASPSTGIYFIELPLSLTVSVWGSLANTLFMDASTRQIPSPLYSEYQQFVAACVIHQYYQCVNLVTGQVTTRKVVAYTKIPGEDAICKTGEVIRGEVHAGLSSIFYVSTPLGDCLSGGIGTADTAFYPIPEEQTIDVGDSSQICLCATGGSGAYSYSIVDGELPCGMALNEDTGCLEGEPNGTCPGTTSVTFRVTDTGTGGSAGDPVPPVTIGGTCRVFGDGLTRISGGAFTIDMAGSFFINGVGYMIASVTPPDNLTLTAAVGILDPATWSFTFPAGPAPPPSPPDSAEVTCGFLSECPDDTGTTGGNSTH